MSHTEKHRTAYKTLDMVECSVEGITFLNPARDIPLTPRELAITLASSLPQGCIPPGSIDLESENISSWKGHILINNSKSLLLIGLPKLRASSRCSLKSDRFSTITSFFEEPVPVIDHLLSEEPLPNIKSELTCWSFTAFPCVLLLVTRGRRSAPPLHCLSSGSCRLWWGHPPAFSSLS